MKIGFIGCGNMGSALAHAVARMNPGEIYVSDANAEKAQALAYSIHATVSTNETIAGECNVIFLAVKPNMYITVLESLRDMLSANQQSLVISMAAGIPVARVATMMYDTKHPVIRIMPNTPCAVGRGTILWCKNATVTADHVGYFLWLLSGAGMLDEIDEKLIDAGSAVSGCGPAFVYMFIEALADGAVASGLPRDKAMRYAAETLIGAAEMVKQSGKHPGQLKDEVCSPGGSTIEGVETLEAGRFRAAVSSAVINAYKKTVDLGK